MKFFARIALPFALLVAGNLGLQAQCETWTNAPNSEEIVEWHVTYRQFVKGKQAADIAKLDQETFDIAFNNWEKCWEAAPKADGQRPFHFMDGRKLLKAKAMRIEDEAQKTELGKEMISIYDREIQCYPNKEAYLLGRKAWDMFYAPAYGYSMETMEAMEKAVNKAGNDMEYILVEPLSQLVAYLFKAGKIDQPRAQQVLNKAYEAAEYNVENNEQYGAYFESALARGENQLGEVKDEIFDCDYFSKRLLPQYEENPTDIETVRFVYQKLKAQGCDTAAQYMTELRDQYVKLATEINAQLESKRRMENPGYDAAQLQKEGKYEEAVSRYQDAVDQEEDPDDKAQFLYSMAFIQTWQLNRYGQARRNANEAASLRKEWGKPFILIGDIYVKMSRISCDDWNSRLAILAAIDKYAYARSIDSDVADEAASRISNYNESKPLQQDGFMRGIKAGDTVTVGCGIGERVKVRYQ